MDRYSNPVILKTSDNRPYYKGKFYPNIPVSENDIYVITTIGDRFDLLALQYYNDPSLWWIISSANENLPQNSLYISVGTQLRIPTDVSEILTNYRSLNQ
jgi:hypothetical protein